MIITLIYLYPMLRIAKFECVVSARFSKRLKQKFPMRLGLCVVKDTEAEYIWLGLHIFYELKKN